MWLSVAVGRASLIKGQLLLRHQYVRPGEFNTTWKANPAPWDHIMSLVYNKLASRKSNGGTGGAADEKINSSCSCYEMKEMR